MFRWIYFLSFFLSLSLSTSIYADEITTANNERLAVATGHFARARSLLNAAVREFDQGQKIADPSALLDVKLWRDTLLERSQELNRVLDPQPRASNTGVMYNADTRLLNESKE
jgi:hypothetical protein